MVFQSPKDKISHVHPSFAHVALLVAAGIGSERLTFQSTGSHTVGTKCTGPGQLPGGREQAMELTVLAVPDCPNAPELERRLIVALADRPAITVTRRVITELAAAARWGMHGSPTLLVNGWDPFAEPGTGPAVACRLYRDEDGRLDRAPTVAALRAVLERAGAPG
jgi:hypothetical protein